MYLNKFAVLGSCSAAGERQSGHHGHRGPLAKSLHDVPHLSGR
jgi:hypothetical protein